MKTSNSFKFKNYTERTKEQTLLSDTMFECKKCRRSLPIKMSSSRSGVCAFCNGEAR